MPQNKAVGRFGRQLGRATRSGDLQGVADLLSQAEQDASLFGEIGGPLRPVERRAGRARQAFERLGGEFDPSGNPLGVDFDPVDFSEGPFDRDAARRSFNTLRDIRGAQGRNPRRSVFNASVQAAAGERKQEETTKRVTEELIDKAVINAENEANLLGQFTANKKREAEDSLRVTAAALGLRGLDPRSPAGAALASATAQRASDTLTRGLAELGFKIDMSNSEGRREGVQFLQQALNVDEQFIRQSEDELNAILEAVQQRRELEAMMNALARDAEPSGFEKYGPSAVSLLAAPFTGGASLLGLGLGGLGDLFGGGGGGSVTHAPTNESQQLSFLSAMGAG